VRYIGRDYLGITRFKHRGSTANGHLQLAFADIGDLFIFVLVLWLCLIFASFSMSSSANPTLMATLLACALAAATAIYLILELGQPFDGLLQIPNESLRTALKPVP